MTWKHEKEKHPAMALVQFNRSHHGGTGAVLFGSDLRYPETITLTVRGVVLALILHREKPEEPAPG